MIHDLTSHFGFYHPHCHEHCPMGGNHCKHTCPDCGERYCCKCGQSFGGRYWGGTPWYYASGSLLMNTAGQSSGGIGIGSVSASCSHSHS